VRMKATAIFLLFLSIVFLIGPATSANDTALNIEPGKIAVDISFDHDITGPEFNRANLELCLKNHLDYYLWYKGWNFEFVDGEISGESADIPGFDYLLNMRVKASFKSKKIRLNDEKEKVNYSGLLRIGAAISFNDLRHGAAPISDERKFSASSEKKWVRSPDGGYYPPELTIPEPPDFVVKRLLSEALAFLPKKESRNLNLKTDIPVYLLVDKHITAEVGDVTDSDVYTALKYASRSLQRQFGFGLKPVGYADLATEMISFDGFQRLFDRIRKNEPQRPDTLTIAVFEPLNPERFYARKSPSRIGLSDLGRQFSLLARLRVPESATIDWTAYINGQLMLHEIGHLLGAVHVSDLKSIMNPVTTWVSSDRFDHLNLYIIKRGRRVNPARQSLVDYLNLVVAGIENSEYALVDYPPLFFSYVNLNRYKLKDSNYGGGDAGRTIPYAVSAFRMYLLKNYHTARDNFYKALACDPGQASIHYYLSKTTTGKLSELHLKKAAEMGYYIAIHELGESF